MEICAKIIREIEQFQKWYIYISILARNQSANGECFLKNIFHPGIEINKFQWFSIQKYEDTKNTRVYIWNLNSLKLLGLFRDLFSSILSKIHRIKILKTFFIIILDGNSWSQLLLSQSSTSSTTNDHKGGSKFDGNAIHRGLSATNVCIDRMQRCVNREYIGGTRVRERERTRPSIMAFQCTVRVGSETLAWNIYR